MRLLQKLFVVHPRKRRAATMGGPSRVSIRFTGSTNVAEYFLLINIDFEIST